MARATHNRVAIRLMATLNDLLMESRKLTLKQRGRPERSLRGHEAIAFEDSHTGSLAAKRANMWAVAAPNESTAHHDFGHVDLKVTSLAEVTLAQLITRFSKP